MNIYAEILAASVSESKDAILAICGLRLGVANFIDQ
jgi:hypothetical protein